VPDLGIWYLISRAIVILSTTILSQFSRIQPESKPPPAVQ
jgi:hypothetical protein